jgi:transcriptional regulator with XRE-family HTH domain
MEKNQIQRIKGLMETKGINVQMLASECGKNHMTIRRILQDETYNPTIDTIKAIASALGVDEQYILDGKDFSPKDFKGVKGYIDYKGKISRINTLGQLQKIYEAIKSDLEIPNKAKDLISQDKANKKTQSKTLDVTSINLFQTEQYDTSKVATWDFRQSKDERDEQPNNLGNMCGGYEFDLSDVHFLNSEAAYICGLFSNDTQEHQAIQKELIEEVRGYKTKKVIRKKYENLGRKDWETFNVPFMIYVVWTKVRQNKTFSDLLRHIPSNCIIIENSTYQKGKTSLFWGAKNDVLEEKRNILEKNAEIQNYGKSKKDIAFLKMQARNRISNYGTWEGKNCMGKILTICKHCLENGTEPPIDYELLRSKQIYLLGKLLTFDDSRLHQPKKKKRQ